MILYSSKYGGTEAVVRSIVEAATAIAPGATGLVAFNLLRQQSAAAEALSAAAPQRVLVVAPIYAGRLSGKVTRFLEGHRAELERHTVACAVSCLYPSPRAEEQLAQAFPDWLVARAVERFAVGGRIRLEELSAPVRLLMRMAAGLTESVDTLRFDLAPSMASWLMGSGSRTQP